MPTFIEKKKKIIQTIEEEKNELAIKLLSLKDNSIVHDFHLIFDELTSARKRTTIEEYNTDIDEAVSRVRQGKSVSNDDIMREMDKW